jgi:hypothetical protein
MYDKMMTSLNQRMLYADELGTPLLASAGTHLLQLCQKKNEFYFLSGRKERLNMCACMVAPPGCSKSFSMSSILGKNGILPIHNSSVAVLTEAGLVGTVNSEGNKQYGLAFDYKDGIIVIDEMSTLLSYGAKEETTSLLNVILEMISEGRVSKKLARDYVQYETDLTIWGGVQISNKRFDYSGGWSRRALFCMKQWTPKTLKALVKARRLFRNIKPDTPLINELSGYVRQRNISEFTIDEKLLDYIEAKSLTPNESIKMEKAAMGLAFWLDYKHPNILEVKYCKEQTDFIKIMDEMWTRVCIGPEISVAKGIIGKKGVDRLTFFKIMGSLGYTELATTLLIEKMFKSGLINGIAKTISLREYENRNDEEKMRKDVDRSNNNIEVPVECFDEEKSERLDGNKAVV